MNFDMKWFVGGLIAGAALAFLRVKSAPTVGTPRAMGGLH